MNLFLLTSCIVVASPMGREEISRDSFKGTWPFTVSQGVLTCLKMGRNKAVLLDVDDTWYALNGIAKAKGRKSGFMPVEPIWLIDKRISKPDFIVRVSLGGVISRGLTLCQ